MIKLMILNAVFLIFHMIVNKKKAFIYESLNFLDSLTYKILFVTCNLGILLSIQKINDNKELTTLI